jgi:hypothetical protein
MAFTITLGSGLMTAGAVIPRLEPNPARDCSTRAGAEALAAAVRSF